jgi:hypothetical protein
LVVPGVARGVATVAALVALLAGCGVFHIGQGTTPEQRLMARPTVEQVSQEYLAVLGEIRAAVSGIVPDLRWEETSPKYTPSTCDPPYAEVEGAISAVFASGHGLGTIPDSSWPKVVTAVTQVAEHHRFTEVDRLVEKPGHYALMIFDRWGGSITVGSDAGEYTSVSLFSACLLLDRARQRISRSTSTPAAASAS